MSGPSELKELLRREALAGGFVLFGVAAAEPSPRSERFAEFLSRGFQAGMDWLARRPEARCDPRSLLEGARSVVCLAASHADDPATEAPPGGWRIARYARGRDYHRLLRRRCRDLLRRIPPAAGAVRAKVCVDTAPLLERDLAASAGLGWIGRNGLLVNRTFGSYLLLAEIVTDLPLPADRPVKSACGNCRACLRACPTGAIEPDGLVDSRRCLSYLTIEHRGDIPETLRPRLGGRLFGCDRCQEVCPHNARVPLGDADLRGPTDLARTSPAEVLSWRREDWDRLTRGSAARRATWEMFLRNAALAAGSTDDASVRPLLERLAADGPHLARPPARWAMKAMAHPSDRRGRLTPPPAGLIRNRRKRRPAMKQQARDDDAARQRIAAAVEEILQAIGEDPDRPGLKGTPERVARAYLELFAGLGDDPARHFQAVFQEKYDEMVVLRDVPFHSMCEHHLLPFMGKAHLAYLPVGRVIGISKLARVVESFARRPQLQERLTAQIADLIMQELQPKGVAVILEAEHTCMIIRGVKKPGSVMVTSAVRGLFKTNPSTRSEVMSLLRG